MTTVTELKEAVKTFLLEECSFKQENPDEPIFKLQRVFQHQGPTMTVNGHRIQAPDQEVIQTITVELFGPGYIDDMENAAFELIRFNFEELANGGKDVRQEEMIEGVYPEDFEKVKTFIKQICLGVQN